MKRKILLYGDLDLNLIDGSSIWLFSLAKLLAQDSNNVIDILLKKKIIKDTLVKELYKYSNISLFSADEFIPKIKEVDCSNIKAVINMVDEYRDYSLIIVRGFAAVKSLIDDQRIAKKLIPYLTDFNHNEETITDEEKSSILNIYNSVSKFFVQTPEMKNYLIKILKIDGEKFSLLSPMIFNSETNFTKMPKSIVYAGKIAQNWNILELIEIMDELYKTDPEITLHMIGDKFNRDLAHRKEEILKKLKSMPNVKFYGSLSKEQTTSIVQKCELGYSFRSEEIDNDKSLELSSKLLEYCFCEVPILLRKTKMHSNLLGEDYPLYVESKEECITKILDFFSNTERYEKLKKELKTRVERYKPENIYKNIIEALDFYPKKKMRLLITGHDLKFIKDLYPYFEKEYDLTVQEYKEYTDLNISESKELLKRIDIIWCEWLLYNAEWYTIHKYPYQKIFIRAHRFELARPYAKKIKWNKVERLITVSYYYLEEFISRFKIPRYKVKVINNYINTRNYSTKKMGDYKYNIAMIGILPKRKGFDRAVEILYRLKQKDVRYKLFIAGKKPEEFANTRNVNEEAEYYKNVYSKINDYGLENDVIYTGWVNVPEFLEKIGYTLSLSDKEFPESFHISPFECMVSEGIGLATRWNGIEYLYPDYVIYDNIEDVVSAIEKYNEDENEYKKIAKLGREFTIDNYDIEIIWEEIYKEIEKVIR